MKRRLLYLSQVLTVLALAFLSGCASVAMMDAAEDTRAKSFAPPPGKANIYVYRNETMGAAITMEVMLDGNSAGKTASKTYFLFEVSPGTHELASKAENTSTLRIDAQAGRNYFVWQEVKMGVMSARSQLSLVDDTTGRAGVNECKRVQSSF